MPEILTPSESGESYQPRIFAWNGRLGRLRYLAYMGVFQLLFHGFILVQFIQFIGLAGVWKALDVVQLVTFCGFTTVASAIFVRRRLHDLDKSGWLILLMLVPWVNLIFPYYILFARGTEGDNRFGLPPVANHPALWFFGLTAIIVIIAVHTIFYLMEVENELVRGFLNLV